MALRTVLAILAAGAAVVAASVLVLVWTGDRLQDMSLRPALPAEAGEPLDPADAAWLDPVPDRTIVDPQELEAALTRLSAEIATTLEVVDLHPPAPRTTRVQVPRGWGETSDVLVLIGATRHATLASQPDRCAFLDDTMGALVATGWHLTVERRDAIQTEYPIVTPGPVDLTVRGRSTIGEVAISAPASGDYRVDLAIDAATAARDETQAASEAIGQAGPFDCE